MNYVAPIIESLSGLLVGAPSTDLVTCSAVSCDCPGSGSGQSCGPSGSGKTNGCSSGGGQCNPCACGGATNT